MKHAWIVLYQMPEGILYTHGFGTLTEAPQLPNLHPTDHMVLEWDDLVLTCVYDTTIEPTNAHFLAESVYTDGIFY